MVVTVTGANDFARLSELKKLTGAFIAEHGDMAVERFDGDEASAARMRESVTSLPFLTDRKLVLLQEPGKQKAWAEQISDVLKSVADSTDLIIIEPKLDKRLSYYKVLKKNTDFRDFADLDANGLTRWASEYVKVAGGTLASGDARLLIDRVGANQQMIQQELNKLLSYDLQISRKSIELLTNPMPQSTVFELLDAAFGGNKTKTFGLYHEQRALKVEPQAIIAMLGWQLHALALVKTADHRSTEAIAKEGKVNPYVVRKTQSLAREISLERLKKLIHDLLQLDLNLKTKTMDADEALQWYLLSI